MKRSNDDGRMGPSPCCFAKQTRPALWLSTPASHARGKPGLGQATGCPVSSSLRWALCPERHAQPRSCLFCSWSRTCYLPAPGKALPSVLMEVTASGPELSRTSWTGNTAVQTSLPRAQQLYTQSSQERVCVQEKWDQVVGPREAGYLSGVLPMLNHLEN